MATDEPTDKLIRYSNVLAATRAGSLSELRRLLDDGHPIDCKDNQNWIALHAACYEGYSNILSFLLNYYEEKDIPSDINYRSHEGFTPIFIAIREGFRVCLEILLKFGADVCVGIDGLGDVTVLFGERDERRNNCFQCLLEWIANRENKVEILKILDGTNKSWMEVVVRAALRNNPRALNLVIKHCHFYLTFATVLRVVLFSISHSGKEEMLGIIRKFLGEEEYKKIIANLFKEEPSAVVKNVEKEISLPLAHSYLNNDKPSKVPSFLGECCGVDFFWELVEPIKYWEVALMSIPFILDFYGTESIERFNKKFNKKFQHIRILGKRVIQYHSMYIAKSKLLKTFALDGIDLTLSTTALCVNCSNLDLLLKVGAPVNSQNFSDLPPIALCLELKNFQGAKTLLGAGALCYHPFPSQDLEGNQILFHALFGGWRTTLLLQKLGMSLESLITFDKGYDGKQFKLHTLFYYFNQYSQWGKLLNVLLKWFKLPFEIDVAKKCFELLAANSWNKSVWSEILREELNHLEKPLLFTLKHLATIKFRQHLKFKSFQNPKLLYDKLNIPQSMILYVLDMEIPLSQQNCIFFTTNYKESHSNYLEYLFKWLETIDED